MAAHLGQVDCNDCDNGAGTSSIVTFLTRTREIAKLGGADFGVTTDQAIAIPSNKWVIHRVFAVSPTGDVSDAVGGIYTESNKGGIQVVRADQTYAGLTGANDFKDLNVGDDAEDTIIATDTVYFSLTTPAVSGASADIYIEFDDLDPHPVETVIDENKQVCTKYYSIPGPKGDAGDPGADGTNGSSAYTATTDAFTQPVASASVTVDVADGNWFAVGAIVFVEGAGYYEVLSYTPTTVTIKNLNYDSNVPAATVVGSGAKVIPAGEKGQETGTTVEFDDIAPTTTKGDIIAHNGTDNVRIPAGVDEFMVLRTAPGEAAGVKWERIALGTWTMNGSIPVANGGTGASSATNARANLGAAKSGINTDITQINGLTQIKVHTTNGSAVDGIFSATASLDFGPINAAESADLTITVTGAATGDVVILGLPASPTAGIIFQAFVSAADTVTVRATNITGAPVDPSGATYRATVISHA